MLRRLRNAQAQYPGQFWLIFWGNLISTIGMSMIWPFMMIYASEKLDLPLTAVASIMSVNALMSLLSGFLAGPLTDRIGRRSVMIVGLALHGFAYLSLNFADSLLIFGVLMAVSGFVSPIYRVGVDAMVADLIPQENRPDAYALLRMGNNIGVALGPSIGGFLAARSYSIVFSIAAAGLLIYCLLTLIFSTETMPPKQAGGQVIKEKFGGYDRVLKDKMFLSIFSGFTITTIAASMIFVLLSVYAKEQYRIPENQFGFIMAANAAMVVLFQVLVTRISKRFEPFRVMTLGAFFYSIGVGSVALGHSFTAFLLSVVIMTSGELLLVPTSTTVIANLAPPDMRGRYMSIYGLSWGIASGVGPLMGGVLSDLFSPPAMWVGGFAIGMLSVVLFGYLAVRVKIKSHPGVA